MLIDDNNKDPTFVYSVSEKTYKVPSRKEQAAREAGMLEGIGYIIEGGTFAELMESALDVRQTLEAAYQIDASEVPFNFWKKRDDAPGP